MTWTNKPTLRSGVYPKSKHLEAIIDQIDSLTFSEWTEYTPTWTGSVTNPVIGNGTILGRYRRANGADLVHGDIRIAMGSTTTYGSGFWAVSLAVTPTTASSNAMVQVGVVIDASSGATYPCAGRIFGSTLVVGAPSGGLVNATTPMTFATSDEVRINVFYEPDS